jgi:hypothetical protein
MAGNAKIMAYIPTFEKNLKAFYLIFWILFFKLGSKVKYKFKFF